ncbi:MAG: HAD-IIB family hydrolase [Bacteriovoracaceae bacterium]|nr:HAD-IIB family hydrolase [Bacteriovoracaceae bacterium]
MTKLYISDLDGTLLNAKGELSAYSRHQLIHLLERGVHFSVASARSLSSIKHLMKGIPLQLPVIALNGASISSLATGIHDVMHVIDEHLLNKICATVQEHGLRPFFSANDGIKHNLHGNEQVSCITITGDEHKTKNLLSILRDQYQDQLQVQHFQDHYSPKKFWIMIQNNMARKDYACLALANSLNIPMSQVTVFGDEFNDIEMLEVSGVGVAMGNAIEALKQVADEVIGTNLEDSVIKYLLANS